MPAATFDSNTFMLASIWPVSASRFSLPFCVSRSSDVPLSFTLSAIAA